jgi:hypothetical protein
VTGRIRLFIAVLFASGLLGASVPPAFAHFERFYASSRAFSLGGSFVALADDPAATVVNPAGLTQTLSPSFLVTYTQPYNITDLEEHFLAAALPTRLGAFGISWHRFGLRDVTSEDLFSIAYGRDLIRTSQDASLSVGGGIDVARVSYQGAGTDAKSVVTGSLSILLRPFQPFGVGYTVRNLGAPAFTFLSGDTGTRLETTHAFGFAYHWRRRAVFLYERFRAQSGRWRDSFGVEMNAIDQLKIRGGFAQKDITGGIGVRVSHLDIDVGVTAHEVLGLSYHASLVFRMPSSQPGAIP